MKTLLKNCNLISPDIELDGAAILIDGQKIKQIFTSDDKLPEADKVIDVKGNMVMPGFVDVHCTDAPVSISAMRLTKP